MSNTSCAQAVDCAETDPARLVFPDMARGAATTWRDFLCLVDSAFPPIAWLDARVPVWDPRARRMALWSSLSDRALRDVGLARGGVEFLSRHPEEARDGRRAPGFE